MGGPDGGLDEDQLNLALAVDESNPMWRALHQLIKTAETNAYENAGEEMDPPTILAGYVGGGKHLGMLREDLIARRETGLRLLGEEEKLEKAMKGKP